MSANADNDGVKSPLVLTPTASAMARAWAAVTSVCWSRSIELILLLLMPATADMLRTV